MTLLRNVNRNVPCARSIKLKQTSKSSLEKDTIQNFQFSRVRVRTYSSNISFILLVLCLETGAPVAGSID